MFGILIKGAKFIRKNPSLLFSLLLIIVIPALVFFITSFLAKSFQDNIDLTLQKQAIMIQDVLSPYVLEHYSQPEILQERLKYLAENNSDLKKIRVFVPAEGDNFRIVASNLEEEKDEEISETPLTLAWHKDQAIAFLSREEGIRFWNVISPAYNNAQEKIGMTGIALSLKEADDLVTQGLQKAYIFVTIAIILILSLIIHHTRLFQYVSLFRKLSEIDRAKDSFMNMTVHELRSPVVNIRNYILELKKGIFHLLSSEQKLDLNRIELSVNRFDNLISDVLNVIQIEQGRLSFDSEVVLPWQLINEVVEELRFKIAKKGLKINFIQPGTVDKIMVNPNRFKEVIYNLLDNAIKYTPKGEINIITEINSSKGKFYITIADTGLGISAEDSIHLFERFYRVKNRETADIEGTGLGLWIVKQICAKMDGKILLESIKGVGSKFVLIFPLVKS
ncbi:HAMP domain-containing histidine kinase [Patescibacteria group bacterium]|nr:HAMP domain-containing histidine kinase [Patescibacteria group bacterium]